MGKNNDGEKKSSTKKHIGKYKLMLKNKVRYYFDVEEFADIVEYYINKEKLREAETALNYALNQHPGAYILLLKQAQIYVESERPEEALSLLKKLRAIHPEEAEVYFWIGIVEISKNNIDSAEENFDKLLKFLKEEDKDILLLVAFSYIQHGEFSNALRYLNKAYKIDPKNSYVLYDSAYCYEQIQDYENSIVFYKKYLEINPFESTVWYNLGVIFSKNGETENAIEAYDFSIAVNPKFAAPYYNKALLFAEIGKTNDAVELYNELLSIEQNSTDGLLGLAECYRTMEEFELSTKTYEKVLALDKNNVDALYGMASVAALTDNNLEGLNYVIRALRIEKRNPELYYLSAKIFNRLGYLDRAEVQFQKAITLNPEKAKYWISYIDIFTDQESEKIIEILSEASKIIPTDAQIKYLLAQYLYMNKSGEKASKILEKAVALSPDLLDEFLENCPEAAQYAGAKLMTKTG